MSNPCREDRVNNLIHRLEGVDGWVCPRRLRDGNLLDDKSDELVTETFLHVLGEILDPRIDPGLADDPHKGERWERVLLKLEVGCTLTYER